MITTRRMTVNLSGRKSCMYVPTSTLFYYYEEVLGHSLTEGMYTYHTYKKVEGRGQRGNKPGGS
jgi:hypothetical protein